MKTENMWDLARQAALPNDAECMKWYDDNIDGDSASSAIYKFRLWLNDRLNPVKESKPQHQYRSTRENNGVWVNCSKEEYDAAMDLARFEVRVVEI